MRSVEQIKSDIYEVIMQSPLSQMINGVVRKTKRPLDSATEDVVISVLANQNGQVQIASVNVNIYVQDLFINNQYEEDTKRCDFLCQLAADNFDVFFGDTFRCRLLSQELIEADHEHIINNRIEYKQNNE